MAEIARGMLAPDFSLATEEGPVTLSELRGKTVVLYFYPADDTETCTLEAIDFSARRKAFEAAGATILGVSPDPVSSHQRFCKKHGLGIRLASDPEMKVIRRYGLWIEKSMFGRKFMGVERATFLIDAKGRIARVWHKVRIKNHVDQVLEAAKNL
jgi:peroxiredoxin Q/BCP